MEQEMKLAAAAEQERRDFELALRLAQVIMIPLRFLCVYIPKYADRVTVSNSDFRATKV